VLVDKNKDCHCAYLCPTEFMTGTGPDSYIRLHDVLGMIVYM